MLWSFPTPLSRTGKYVRWEDIAVAPVQGRPAPEAQDFRAPLAGRLSLTGYSGRLTMEMDGLQVPRRQGHQTRLPPGPDEPPSLGSDWTDAGRACRPGTPGFAVPIRRSIKRAPRSGREKTWRLITLSPEPQSAANRGSTGSPRTDKEYRPFVLSLSKDGPSGIQDT